MAKVIHEPEKCIGCHACESSAPDLFQIVEKEGKPVAELKGSKKEGNLEIKELSPEEIEKAKEAESVCPVGCIHVKE